MSIQIRCGSVIWRIILCLNDLHLKRSFFISYFFGCVLVAGIGWGDINHSFCSFNLISFGFSFVRNSTNQCVAFWIRSTTKKVSSCDELPSIGTRSTRSAFRYKLYRFCGFSSIQICYLFWYLVKFDIIWYNVVRWVSCSISEKREKEKSLYKQTHNLW